MTEAPLHLSDASRVALISGGNRGIGAAIAQRLAQAGWNLSLGMRTPVMPDWADGARVQVVAYDATAREGAEGEWVRQAIERFGRIDAVVANAGVMIPRSVIEIDDTDLDHMFEVNLRAPRRLAQAAWESLCRSGSGRAILIASLSGKRVKSVRAGSYSLTKFACVALAHALRQEGWEHGVRATAICPGLVDTDMGRAAAGRSDIAMTGPEDVARAVELVIGLPNAASVAEFTVNCQLDENY